MVSKNKTLPKSKTVAISSAKWQELGNKSTTQLIKSQSQDASESQKSD